MVSRPLEGLRVLDLTRFVAGSEATALLAALGADVIKLEVPPDGDPYRAQGTERLGDQSALFLSLNSGKRSVASASMTTASVTSGKSCPFATICVPSSTPEGAESKR